MATRPGASPILVAPQSPSFCSRIPRQPMTKPTAEIPPELFARLAHPTVRLSGSIDKAAAASFLSQVLPALDVPGSIVVELFSSGGDAEVGRRLVSHMSKILLRQWLQQATSVIAGVGGSPGPVSRGS
jgi:hypothetical protein